MNYSRIGKGEMVKKEKRGRVFAGRPPKNSFPVAHKHSFRFAKRKAKAYKKRKIKKDSFYASIGLSE